MRNKMATQQKIALEMILAQDQHGGLSKEAILLHQKQAEDAEKMEERMNVIEKKVDSLDKKVDTLDKKIDELKLMMNNKSSFKANLKEVLSNKVFLYLLISIMGLLCGTEISGLGTFLFK